MRLFCIDTCFDACSVGIFEAHAPLYQALQPLKRGHAELLAPMTREVFEATDLSIQDMDRLVVTIGPGSFTGIRVGVAFARGLAIGQTIEVVGVTSLQVIAQSAINAAARDTQPVDATCFFAALINARYGEVYGQIFARDQTALCAPFKASPADALLKIDETLKNNAPRPPQIVLVGSGADLVRTALQEATGGQARKRAWHMAHFKDDLMAAPQPGPGLDLAIVARLANHFTPQPIATPLYIGATNAQKIR